MSSVANRMASGIEASLFAKSHELRSRLWYLIFILMLYRIGTYIPIPGVDPILISEFAATQTAGLLGMFNVLTGGALSRMSIFALNIMPYITASIAMQLVSFMLPFMASLRKDGEAGRRKILQYTKYLAFGLALIQGYGLAAGLENITHNSVAVVSDPGMVFRVIAMLNLAAGTIFVMWLSEQISTNGVGNGSSMIIFSGIVSSLPSSFVAVFELGRAGGISSAAIILILSIAFGLIYLIVFFEKAQRRILVQYPKRQIGNKIYSGDATHIPLKINTSGVMAPIFASSVLLFPSTIINLIASDSNGILYFIVSNLMHGKPAYIILYITLICLFSFIYTSVIFNAQETADNLRKGGGVINGKRPGAATAQFFEYVLNRITVLGALYMSLVCVLPEILMSHYAVPFYLGGTSLLILVNVVLDFMSQLQSYVFGIRYEHLLKKHKKHGLLV